MIKEFKEFALKGNVMDMAVGIIIGAAFGKIVTSIVNDLIMPVVGIILGGVNFTHLKIVLSEAVMAGGEVVKPEVALNYGNFIQTTVDFLIVTFCVFMVIRGLNKLKRKPQEGAIAEEIPAAPTETELLTEIRDLLKTTADKTQQMGK